MCGLLIVVLFPVVEPRVQALELGFSSCGARAQLPQGMWNLLGTGIEPVSAALTSRFLTTELPGKSRIFFFFNSFKLFLLHWGIAN